jgi:arylsulfatase
MPGTQPPNVVYFHVDNLGYGELGCYGGGILRGAATPRIDGFATEGYRLTNYAPEAQCTPSRTALMTGRYAIRTGNHTVAVAGGESGIVAWERTLGDLFSDAGYATMCMGKWHIGDCDGRWPTDHGFDEWYGPPHSYDEAFWDTDPWYDPERDPVSYMLEARKGEPVRKGARLTYELKLGIDVEYKRRAFRFMEDAARDARPFFLYFNHSLMHMPVVPRDEYRGRSGNGDWATACCNWTATSASFSTKSMRSACATDTIVVFAGDNGNEEMLLHRGTGGFFDGSYFTGREAALRTPCIARWPGRIAANRTSNEIVHITDWFTTLLRLCGLAVPPTANRRQGPSPLLRGEQEQSNRDGFIFWNGERMYGIKWRNFKMVLVDQNVPDRSGAAAPVAHVINLLVDPKEREPFNRSTSTRGRRRTSGGSCGSFRAASRASP